MWNWSSAHLAKWYGLAYEEYVNEARLDDAIVIECWKYMNEETSSGTISEEDVKYIKEDEIPVWLE